MMLELKKKGVIIPTKVIEDLRSAKSMIQLCCAEGDHGDATQKAEEYLANVEAYVVTEGQKVFSSEKVDEWFKRLEMANTELCEGQAVFSKFVTGVPRDLKWIRIEPMGDFTTEKVEGIAKGNNMLLKRQIDGRLLVYGQAENLKAFLKEMSALKTKK
jgi:hypothetical protein